MVVLGNDLIPESDSEDHTERGMRGNRLARSAQTANNTGRRGSSMREESDPSRPEDNDIFFEMMVKKARALPNDQCES